MHGHRHLDCINEFLVAMRRDPDYLQGDRAFARFFGVCTKTIERWRAAGLFPFKGVATKAKLERWLVGHLNDLAKQSCNPDWRPLFFGSSTRSKKDKSTK